MSDREYWRHLRNRAERLLAQDEIPDHPTQDSEQALRQMAELQIYQAELELQNQELIDAQVQTQKALEHYRNLFLNLPLPALLLDDRGFIVEVNARATEWLALADVTAAQHLPAFQLFARESRENFHALLKSARSGVLRQATMLWLQTTPSAASPCDAHVIDFGSAIPGHNPQILLVLVDRAMDWALQESEQRFARMADVAPILVWVSDTAGRRRWFNRRWLVFTGRGRAQELGKGWLDAVHPDDRERCRSEINLAVSRQQPFSLEYRLRRNDGLYRWMLDNGQPHFDPSGVCQGYVGASVDLTTSQELRQQLDKLSEQVPGMLYQFQRWPDGRAEFPFLRGSLLSKLNVSAEVVAKDANVAFSAIHPDDVNGVWTSIEQSAANLTPWQHHYRVYSTAGDLLWLEGESTPERQEDGSIVWYGYLRDITEQKRIEADLLNEKARLANIIWCGDLGTWEWNLQTGEALLNERWAEIVGYTLAELGPPSVETWWRFVHPEDVPLVKARLERHFNGETDFYECEVRMRHRNGGWVWVLDRGRVVQRSAEGAVEWMAGTHLDISLRKATEAQLHASEERMRLAVNAVQDGIWDWDLITDEVFFSPIWKAQIGYADHELENRFATFEAHLHPDDAPSVMAKVRSATAGSGKDFRVDFRFRHKDGSWRWILSRGQVLHNESGQPYRMLGHHTDVTEQRHLEAGSRLAASVFRHVREGIMIINTQGEIIDVNESFTRITGYPAEAVLGRTPALLFASDSGLRDYAEMWTRLEKTGYWHGEIWNRRQNGEIYPCLLTYTAVVDDANVVNHYVGLFIDVTAQKEQQRQLERSAHYDALTNLPNRTLFSDRLRQAMINVERRGLGLALAFIDLDGFKAVNDSRGHKLGDQLLVTLAKRMQESLRQGDTIARIGGDEFVALMLDLPEVAAAMPLVQRLQEAAARPFMTLGQEMRVSASIGITWFPQAEDIDADQLLRQADQAMYQAKVEGKNRHHLFDPHQDQHARGHHEVMERVRGALARREFELFYQPKVNMRTGEIRGAEALIRWRHPERGLLDPAHFLPHIGTATLEQQLGEWVVQQALEQMAAWQGIGLKIPVSVNIAARHLQQADFVEQLELSLARFPDVPAQWLQLEILETHALNDIDQVSSAMSRCAELGVQFALDDFGTGYSSLTYLKRLPAAVLKIDQSFVQNMLSDPEDLAILDGILGLARAFRREAIAEGVESIAHGRLLLRLGCEVAQGYQIARPMPADALPDWIRQWHPPEQWLRTRTVQPEELPFVYACVEHKAWIDDLEAFLHDCEPKSPPSQYADCRFNEWLDALSLPASADQQEKLAQIQALHQQVHQIADSVVALKFQDQKQAAGVEFRRLYAVRDELVRNIANALDVRHEPSTFKP